MHSVDQGTTLFICAGEGAQRPQQLRYRGDQVPAMAAHDGINGMPAISAEYARALNDMSVGRTDSNDSNHAERFVKLVSSQTRGGNATPMPVLMKSGSSFSAVYGV